MLYPLPSWFFFLQLQFRHLFICTSDGLVAGSSWERGAPRRGDPRGVGVSSISASCATNLTSGKWIREGIRGAMSCFSDGQHSLGGKMGPAWCSRCPVQLFSTSAGASRCGGELAQHLHLGLCFPIPVGRGDSFPFYICLGWERLSCWHYSAPF